MRRLELEKRSISERVKVKLCSYKPRTGRIEPLRMFFEMLCECLRKQTLQKETKLRSNESVKVKSNLAHLLVHFDSYSHSGSGEADGGEGKGFGMEVGVGRG